MKMLYTFLRFRTALSAPCSYSPLGDDYESWSLSRYGYYYQSTSSRRHGSLSSDWYSSEAGGAAPDPPQHRAHSRHRRTAL